MLQKDEDVMGKEEGTLQGGAQRGWGADTGRSSSESGTGMRWRRTSRVKEGVDLCWGPGCEVPKNVEVSPNDGGI